MIDLKSIRNVDFHDGGLLGLNLSFSERKIYMVLEEEVDSPKITLVFNEVHELNFGALKRVDNIEDIEIYGADFEEIDGKYLAKFTFLIEEGPSWELSFIFEEYDLYR